MFRPLLLILFRSCRNGQNISFRHENRYHNTPHSTSDQISAYFGVFQLVRPILPKYIFRPVLDFDLNKKKKKKNLTSFFFFFWVSDPSSSCFLLLLLAFFFFFLWVSNPSSSFFFFWWVLVLPISFSFFICVLYK